MTAEQFTYWLQGYAELNDAPPSEQQWQAIRDHLALVFNKVAPNWDNQPAMRKVDTRMTGFPPGYPLAGGIAAPRDFQARTVC